MILPKAVSITRRFISWHDSSSTFWEQTRDSVVATAIQIKLHVRKQMLEDNEVETRDLYYRIEMIMSGALRRSKCSALSDYNKRSKSQYSQP